jgi:hypothetical protein
MSDLVKDNAAFYISLLSEMLYLYRDVCIPWRKHHESGLNHVLPSTHIEMYVFYVANNMSLD